MDAHSYLLKPEQRVVVVSALLAYQRELVKKLKQNRTHTGKHNALNTKLVGALDLLEELGVANP